MTFDWGDGPEIMPVVNLDWRYGPVVVPFGHVKEYLSSHGEAQPRLSTISPGGRSTAGAMNEKKWTTCSCQVGMARAAHWQDLGRGISTLAGCMYLILSGSIIRRRLVLTRLLMTAANSMVADHSE